MTAWRRAGLYAAGSIVTLMLVACGEEAPEQAQAPEVDRTQYAADLKADVEKQIQEMEAQAGRDVIAHGAIAVTPQEGSETYLVSVPDLKVTPQPGSELKFGTVSYVVTPKDAASYTISDVKMAETIPFVDASGKEVGKLSLKTKSFSGTWNRELQAYLQSNAEFTDIVATDGEDAEVRIANLKWTSDAADKGQGVYDMTGSFTLSGASIAEQAGGQFKIGGVNGTYKYDSMKLKEYLEAMKKFQALSSKQVAAAEAGTNPTPLSDAEKKDLSDQIKIMAGSVKGGDTKVELTDLAFEEGGQAPFRMQKFGLGVGVTGLDTDKSTISLDVSHGGLEIDTPETNTPIVKATLPKTGNLGLRIVDLPTQALMTELSGQLPNVFGDAVNMEANAFALVASLQGVLQSSTARLEVAPSAWNGEVSALSADGSFKLDPKAITGAVGTLNLALTGFDEVMALAQANPADPTSQNVIGMGAMISSMAKREQGADGKSVDKFKIDVTEQGQILVNDKPFM